MKNQTPFYVFALFVVFVSSCQTKPVETDTSSASLEKEDCTINPKYAVPVAEAFRDLDRYIELMNMYDSVLSTTHAMLPTIPYARAFTIRSIDLIEAMGLPLHDEYVAKYDFVRLYIGLDDSTEFKIFLTPVVGANLSSQPPQAGHDHYLCRRVKDSNGNYAEEEEYVLDFAKPCPNTCPE